MKPRPWITLLLALPVLVVGCASPLEQATPDTAGTMPSRTAAGALIPSPVPATSVPSPGATAEVTATPVPPVSPRPSPTAAASATAPPARPSPSPPPPPSLPPAGPDGWVGPTQVSTRGYGELSLVIDGSGAAHAAAEFNDRIFYLTNASGSWTRERVSRPLPDGSDGQPSIAYDPVDGHLAIAFTRFGRYECFELGCYPADSQGIFLTAYNGSTWTTPLAATRSNAQLPIARIGDGQIHVVYERSTTQTSFIHHATDSGPSPDWADVRIAEGANPSLRIGADGLPRLTFNQAGVQYAVGAEPSGPFNIERVSNVEGWARLMLDATDEPHIVYTNWDDPWSIFYTTRSGGTWATPQLIAEYEIADEAELDERGAVHVIYDVNDAEDDDDQGLWYTTNRSGSFVTGQVDRSVRLPSDGPSAAAALALDANGRPHILYTVPFDEDRLGLYYAVGPAY